MSSSTSLYEFIEKDHYKTLFPMNSTRIFSKCGLSDILKFVNEEIFETKKDGQRQAYFLMQPWVYASKDKYHLRQTFQLDPIALIFLYDFVYRNKKFFVTKNLSGRESFGYSFDGENYNSPSEEYKKFSDKISELKTKFSIYGKVDISNCFNNISS